MEKDCAFIKQLMANEELTQLWLIKRLEKRGIQTCPSILSEVLNCKRKGDKPKQIITASMSILIDYKQRMEEPKY